jgi:hypothetical protein
MNRIFVLALFPLVSFHYRLFSLEYRPVTSVDGQERINFDPQALSFNSAFDFAAQILRGLVRCRQRSKALAVKSRRSRKTFKTASGFK